MSTWNSAHPKYAYESYTIVHQMEFHSSRTLSDKISCWHVIVSPEYQIIMFQSFSLGNSLIIHRPFICWVSWFVAIVIVQRLVCLSVLLTAKHLDNGRGSSLSASWFHVEHKMTLFVFIPVCCHLWIFNIYYIQWYIYIFNCIIHKNLIWTRDFYPYKISCQHEILLIRDTHMSRTWLYTSKSPWVIFTKTACQ